MMLPLLKRSLGVVVLASAVGCAGGVDKRPIEAGPVDTGAGTINAARKFLEGRWTLESFEVFPPGKPPITLKGSGTLTYDDFGNMRMEIRADQQSADLLRAAGIEIRDGVISSDGRTMVDMQNRTLTYVMSGQPVGAPATGPLSPSRPRHWEVKGDLLYLSTKNEAGEILSTGRWKKIP